MAQQSGKTTKSSASQIPETRTKLDLLRVEQLLTEFGATGTQLVNGFLETDYNAELAGITGLQRYEKMRRADAQVNASLLCMELPVRATDWYIEPAKDENGEVTPEAEEHAEFCRMALFEKMVTTWDDTLREILTELAFGFSVFEKVYTADERYVWLEKLAYRKQTTIGKWETEEGQPGITQYLPQPVIGGDNDGRMIISIPANKLLIFSHRREGDNLAGVSVLRSAYKHWYIKDNLYKFDAVRHEKQAVGIPVITLPEDASPEDRVLAEAILARIKANEQAGIVLPSEKWKFQFADLQAGNTSDVWKSIEHHNMMISKNILAMFMELISGEGGSRALSEDQSDFFLLALEAVAKQIDDIVSTYLLKELVDLNFDGVERYPRLAHKRLGRVDYSTLSSTLTQLASSQIITVDDDLEAFVRDAMDLPPAMQQEEVIEEEEIVEVDEDGNPMEPPQDDGGADLEDDDGPGGPEDDEGADDDDEEELAALEEELADVDADEEELAAEDEEEEDEPRFFEIEGRVVACFGGEFYEEDGADFRIVSEETKRKISEALKKALPNKPVKPPRYRRGQPIPEDIKRKISETLKRVKPGDSENPAQGGKKMRSLTQRSLGGQRAAQQRKDPRSPLYQGKAASKVTNAVASRKAARVAKIKRRGGKVATKQEIDAATQRAVALQRKKAVKKPKSVKAKVAKVKSAVAGATTKKQRSVLKAKVVKLRAAVAARKAARLAKRKAVPVKAHEHADGPTAFDGNYMRYADLVDNRLIVKLQSQAETDDDRAELRRKGFLFNDFEEKAWRPLTFAERKVNFTSLKKAVERFGKTLESATDETVANMKDDLLLQVKRAVDNNDIAALGKIRARYTGDLSSALTDVQKEMFEVGKQSASAEMGVKAIATAKEVKGAMRVQNDKIVEAFANDMEAAATKAVTEIAARKGGSITSTGVGEAVAAASASIDKAVQSAKGSMNTLTLIGSLNMGRAAVFERYPEKVYGMQYSAIIDDRTTDICLSLDGRVVKPASQEFYQYSPPRHFNCRSVWVEILQDEEFKPDLGAVPSRIPANATIDTFEDLKEPVIGKGSMAVSVLRAELEEREARVKEYEEDGLYQNRVDSHKARIDALRSALKDAEADAAEQMHEPKTSADGVPYSFFDHVRSILEADGITFKKTDDK